MAKGATRKSAAQAQTPEYELHVRGSINAIDERIEAELKAPALDSSMHPKGALRVNLNTDVGKKPHHYAVLDAFHIDSLIAYLRGQAGIRKALEQALQRDQAEWDPDGAKVTPDQSGRGRRSSRWSCAGGRRSRRNWRNTCDTCSRT